MFQNWLQTQWVKFQIEPLHWKAVATLSVVNYQLSKTLYAAAKQILGPYEVSKAKSFRTTMNWIIYITYWCTIHIHWRAVTALLLSVVNSQLSETLKAAAAANSSERSIGNQARAEMSFSAMQPYWAVGGRYTTTHYWAKLSQPCIGKQWVSQFDSDWQGINSKQLESCQSKLRHDSLLNFHWDTPFGW